MSATVLAVDLGGSRCRAGLASIDLAAAVRPIGEWPAPLTREALLAMLEASLPSTAPPAWA